MSATSTTTMRNASSTKLSPASSRSQPLMTKEPGGAAGGVPHAGEDLWRQPVPLVRRPLAADSRIRARDRRLLRGHAPVGDVRRTTQHAPLVRPDERGAPATVDNDRDRVGEVAVAAVQRAEDAVRADPADMHDPARRGGLSELGARGGAVRR